MTKRRGTDLQQTPQGRSRARPGAHDPARSLELYGAVLGDGAVVGRWTIEALTAHGGFSSVYRAHDASGRLAALKVLHADLLATPRVLRRFRQEAETVERVRHPHVVELHELGELDDGRPFIAMEWLEGVTLDEWLRGGGAMSPEALLRVLEPLAAALTAAHAAGVVHRDLKAENVMLVTRPGRDALVKLLDFGIAKLLDSDQQLTGNGASVGTPSHMAPEQILGQPVGPATDVYALGVLMFHMLTGRLPFDADTALGLETLHLEAQAPRPSDVLARRSGHALDEVILRCLEKDPAHRPNLEELLTDVRAAVGNPGAEPSRVATRSVPAIGVHAIGVDPGLRAFLEQSGFTLVLDEEGDDRRGAVVLAVRVLAGSAIEPGALHRELVRLAGAARVTLHVAEVQQLTIDGVRQLVGGPLLDLDAWSRGGDAPGVELTPAARLYVAPTNV